MLMHTDDCNNGADYEQLADDFEVLECLPSASEYHGLVCGRLAANRQVQDPRWHPQSLEFLGLAAPQESIALKRVLALPELMGTGLNDTDLGFQLWMPSDEEPLEQRLVALSDWCGGFLLGLAWGGLDQTNWENLSTELAEGLNDMVAISGVDELGEGGEADFMQLYEYVRMLALNVSAEMLLAPAESDQPQEAVNNPVSHLFGPGKTRH
jgi:uncharacterized protein YgfB (UPF0149 family)